MSSFKADINNVFSASLPTVTRKYPGRPTSRIRTPLPSSSLQSLGASALKPVNRMKFALLGKVASPNACSCAINDSRARINSETHPSSSSLKSIATDAAA